jgi:DNA invertase Pin-like site-specific DNA recombinase
MTIYGYARVSTRDQDLSAQTAELNAAACAKGVSGEGQRLKGDRAARPQH